jgi:hypothetical protein
MYMIQALYFHVVIKSIKACFLSLLFTKETKAGIEDPFTVPQDRRLCKVVALT